MGTKATGVVRKIDPLGRIVIPKEIRKSQGWDSETPMEMFMSEDGLVIRKYTSQYEKDELISQLRKARLSTKEKETFNALTMALNHIGK